MLKVIMLDSQIHHFSQTATSRSQLKSHLGSHIRTSSQKAPGQRAGRRLVNAPGAKEMSLARCDAPGGATVHHECVAAESYGRGEIGAKGLRGECVQARHGVAAAERGSRCNLHSTGRGRRFLFGSPKRTSPAVS